MADSKITQLTQLAATPAVGDQIEIVDVSDTTMAASGTNKRLAASYLARSDAGAKLITGDGKELTVPATGTAAVLATAQSFTAAQTFANEINLQQHTSNNTWSIDVANGTPIAMASGVVFQFSQDVTFTGLVVIANLVGGQIAMFTCGGGVVTEVADGGGVYSKTKDTATSTNLYFDAGSSEYRLQNNTGVSATYYIFSVRVRAAS